MKNAKTSICIFSMSITSFHSPKDNIFGHNIIKKVLASRMQWFTSANLRASADKCFSSNYLPVIKCPLHHHFSSHKNKNKNKNKNNKFSYSLSLSLSFNSSPNP
ncbi:hypothetical protein RIF29_28835 [Crotalaria pallida]|uniref:Uncharacterized protein n=1 Tax=Crotalaria pallida TaxID=3830 RepID=A0AAN9EDP0_CROPI